MSDDVVPIAEDEEGLFYPFTHCPAVDQEWREQGVYDPDIITAHWSGGCPFCTLLRQNLARAIAATYDGRLVDPGSG